jgi:hypothetical protein
MDDWIHLSAFIESCLSHYHSMSHTISSLTVPPFFTTPTSMSINGQLIGEGIPIADMVVDDIVYYLHGRPVEWWMARYVQEIVSEMCNYDTLQMNSSTGLLLLRSVEWCPAEMMQAKDAPHGILQMVIRSLFQILPMIVTCISIYMLFVRFMVHSNQSKIHQCGKQSPLFVRQLHLYHRHQQLRHQQALQHPMKQLLLQAQRQQQRAEEDGSHY